MEKNTSFFWAWINYSHCITRSSTFVSAKLFRFYSFSFIVILVTFFSYIICFFFFASRWNSIIFAYFFLFRIMILFQNEKKMEKKNCERVQVFWMTFKHLFHSFCPLKKCRIKLVDFIILRDIFSLDRKSKNTENEWII